MGRHQRHPAGPGPAPRQTSWPGERPAPPVEETTIVNRDQDFVDFIIEEVAKRQTAEDRFYAGADPETGEVQ